jgi:hypothetical protein
VFSVAQEPVGFEVTFLSGDVDPASVQLGTTVLVESQGNPVNGTIGFPSGNRMEFLAQGSLPAGGYQVVLRGDAPALTSAPPPAARRLDGDIRPTWPTGNGVEGGDFAFKFTVTP